MPGLNALFIDATAASNDLTGKNCTPNYFRIGVTDGMQVNAFADLAKQSRIQVMTHMGRIAVGHDRRQACSPPRAGETASSIGKTLFAPITAPDLGSYIAQLIDKPAEGLFMYYPSSGESR